MCFVHAGKIAGEDLARQSFDTFMPLDGKFDENVIVQIKNGPMDFQVGTSLLLLLLLLLLPSPCLSSCRCGGHRGVFGAFSLHSIIDLENGVYDLPRQARDERKAGELLDL